MLFSFNFILNLIVVNEQYSVSVDDDINLPL